MGQGPQAELGLGVSRCAVRGKNAVENRDEFATKLEAFMAVAAALRKTTDAARKESRPRYPYARFGLFRNDRRNAAMVTKARTAKRRQSPRAVRATESNPPYVPKKMR
jgi:hypothetical protein